MKRFSNRLTQEQREWASTRFINDGKRRYPRAQVHHEEESLHPKCEMCFEYRFPIQEGMAVCVDCHRVQLIVARKILMALPYRKENGKWVVKPNYDEEET